MKIKTFVIAISLVILFSILGILTYFTFFAPKVEPREEENTTTINEIVGYGIKIDENDTKLYQEEYEKLKNNLEQTSINMEEYAKSIAKLYTIDLYTINNKINKYDVGGLEFIYEKAKENYITNVTDTLYKYVTDNSNNKREQELPEVSSINVDSIEETQYKIEDTTFNAYKINLSWNYIKNLGYDASSEVIVINENDRLYVVEENTK